MDRIGQEYFSEVIELDLQDYRFATGFGNPASIDLSWFGIPCPLVQIANMRRLQALTLDLMRIKEGFGVPA